MTERKKAFVYPTLENEIANAVTHGVGAGLGIWGCVMIILRAIPYGAMAVVGAALYGTSLILLYLASCLYHALRPCKGKHVFRVLDHCSIFILIFGTYIPVSWQLLGTALGWVMFGIVGAASALGIVLNAVNMTRFNKLCQILYIVTGWAIVLTGPIVYKATSLTGMMLLVGGGVLYTIGTFFFRRDKVPFFHAVWHLFVIGGSIAQYFFVYYYCFA